MARITVTINGQTIQRDVDPSRTLAQFLRYDLGLTGTKIGCEEAECGACTVLVDGQPVDSCIYPALKVDGCELLTIEGLAHEPHACGGNGACHSGCVPAPDVLGQRLHLHPLQAAFIEQGATQCGYCTPGFIITAKALLDREPQPTDEQIATALKDTYCRCTGYQAIINAIKQASGQLDHVPLPPTRAGLHAVGRPLPRPDALEKVTGAAKYTDDYLPADFGATSFVYAATKRADYPHARILKIDTSKARALPGVLAVLTHEDVPGKKNHGLIYLDWPVLCYDKVRYVGDAVAIVAAETPEIARQALDLIEVEYEPLPVVTGPLEAAAPDAPTVHNVGDGNWAHGNGNLLKHIHVGKGDVEQGFAQADVIVEREYRTPTTEHAFLEPECSIARVTDEGRVEVYVGSQIPFDDRRQVADCLGIPHEQVRIVGTLIGGGFGGKEDVAGQIHAALLAWRLRDRPPLEGGGSRPVKMLYTRHESLIFHPKRHATVIRLKTGAKKDGTIVAVQAELYGDTGAYASLGDKVMTRATTHAAGPYDVANVKIDCYAMYTNNPPSGAFRGFGVTQSCFAVEQNMDLIAEALGMDPIELRRKNALRVGAVTNTGQLLRESVGLLECLDRTEAAIRTALEEDQADSQEPEDNSHSALQCWQPRFVSPTRVRAWGLATAYKNTGLGGGAADRSGAEVEVFEDGTAIVRAGGAEIGQGLVGVVVQATAEELGLPFARVRHLMSDTDLTPDGGPTTASRQTFTSGNAARLAAAEVRGLLAQTAAEYLNVPPDELRFENGMVSQDGRAVPLGDVVKWARAEGRIPVARVMYEAPATQPLGSGGDMHFGFSFATQAAEVEVDLETGAVQVTRLIGAFDVGRAINPLALLGQIEGGAIMGLGNCLTEEFICEEGRVVTDRLGRYKMPSIRHMPKLETIIVEHELSSGPWGAKGVGEIASIPTSPAITNAIYNACGVRVYRLPVDQDRLLRALRTNDEDDLESLVLARSPRFQALLEQSRQSIKGGKGLSSEDFWETVAQRHP